MAYVKIQGQNNMLEVPNDLAKEIKRIVLDNSISRTTPIDLKVMVVDKMAVSAVFLDVEMKKKFNWYDFNNPDLKKDTLDFETEFNNFDGVFDAFLIYKGADKDTMLAVELNQKLNSLNYLRFLRKKAQQHEAEANKEQELDMVEIAKMF